MTLNTCSELVDITVSRNREIKLKPLQTILNVSIVALHVYRKLNVTNLINDQSNGRSCLDRSKRCERVSNDTPVNVLC